METGKISVMKRTVIAFVMGLSMILWPIATSAGETRVFVSFSIGGAVIVGGGLLFWSFTYTSRVSQNEPDPGTTPSRVRSLTEAPGQTQQTAADLWVERWPEPVQPLPIELPLWVFRW